jgi:hypothetical protein
MGWLRKNNRPAEDVAPGALKGAPPEDTSNAASRGAANANAQSGVAMRQRLIAIWVVPCEHGRDPMRCPYCPVDRTNASSGQLPYPPKAA